MTILNEERLELTFKRRMKTNSSIPVYAKVCHALKYQLPLIPTSMELNTFEIRQMLKSDGETCRRPIQ